MCPALRIPFCGSAGSWDAAWPELLQQTQPAPRGGPWGGGAVTRALRSRHRRDFHGASGAKVRPSFWGQVSLFVCLLILFFTNSVISTKTKKMNLEALMCLFFLNLKLHYVKFFCCFIELFRPMEEYREWQTPNPCLHPTRQILVGDQRAFASLSLPRATAPWLWGWSFPCPAFHFYAI